MKKAMIFTAACLVAGVAGLAVSLPMAAQNALDIYNDAAASAENPYSQLDLPAGVTSLRLVNRDKRGQIYVEVRQSADNLIHLYTYENRLTGSYDAQVSTEGQSAQIDLTEKELERQLITLSRAGLVELLRSEMEFDGSLILEVPTNITITSSEADGVYFGVMGGVEFVNADIIRDYGYVPSDNETWKQRYEEAQGNLLDLQDIVGNLQEENTALQNTLEQYYDSWDSYWGENPTEDWSENPEITTEEAIDESGEGETTTTVEESPELVTPAEVLQLEEVKLKRKEEFRTYQREESVSDYLKALQNLDGMIFDARKNQVIYAGREDLLPLMEEVAAQVTSYDSVEALVLDAQRNYNRGDISQEQYNGIINAYEETIRSQETALIEMKAQLSDAGYYWDSAVVSSAAAN